jgi:hypothetical protein
VIIALLAACGGGGMCEFPPCEPAPPRCDSDADCFESELCDFEGDSCGAASEVGVCTRRPAICSGEIDFTCGCDGQTYANACVAGKAGGKRGRV